MTISPPLSLRIGKNLGLPEVSAVFPNGKAAKRVVCSFADCLTQAVAAK
jgi:hypothetical protein